MNNFENLLWTVWLTQPLPRPQNKKYIYITNDCVFLAIIMSEAFNLTKVTKREQEERGQRKRKRSVEEGVTNETQYSFLLDLSVNYYSICLETFKSKQGNVFLGWYHT